MSSNQRKGNNYGIQNIYTCEPDIPAYTPNPMLYIPDVNNNDLSTSSSDYTSRLGFVTSNCDLVSKCNGGGEVGPQGPTGRKGDTGFGSTGYTGATGIAGIGYTGPTGYGSTGYTGHTGRIGPTGRDGYIGATGITGPTGTQGIPGYASNTGATGNPGINGATGPIGISGITYGLVYYFQYTQNTNSPDLSGALSLVPITDPYKRIIVSFPNPFVSDYLFSEFISNGVVINPAVNSGLWIVNLYASSYQFVNIYTIVRLMDSSYNILKSVRGVDFTVNGTIVQLYSTNIYVNEYNPIVNNLKYINIQLYVNPY